jgi:hypothetical protein
MLFLHHVYILRAVPFYNPIMLKYCVAVLVLLLPAPLLFLFLTALVQSLLFCSANCSLAFFSAYVFLQSRRLISPQSFGYSQTLR